MLNKIVFGLLLLGFIVIDAAPLTNDTQTTSTNPFLNKSEILYSILNNPEGLTKYDVQRVMKKAFNAWSAAIPLTFTEVHPKNMPADILVSFIPERMDGFFKGAYARATLYLEIFFNSDYKWKVYLQYDKYDETMLDLYYNALFAVGQVLGLENNSNPRSIMYDKYILPVDPNENYVEQKLSPEDIQAAQAIYGTKN